MEKTVMFSHKDVPMRSAFYEAATLKGLHVITAGSCLEVLQTLKTRRPDVLVVNPSPAEETMMRHIREVATDMRLLSLDDPADPSCIEKLLEKILKEPEGHAPVRAHRDARILVVDDETDCTQMLARFLDRRGYAVDTARSGEEALEKFKAARPDLTLLDVRLPGMDGILTLKKIYEIEPAARVIMTTAVAGESAVRDAFALGVAGYLIKPFNLLKLEEMIALIFSFSVR